MRTDLNDTLGKTVHEPCEPQRVQPPSRRRWRLTLGVVAVLGAVTVVPSVARAQLTTFTPGAPAMASAVNGNFQQLKTWLEQKVGPSGNNNITTTGTVTAGSTTVNGTLTASGGITTGDLVATGNIVLNGVSLRTKPGGSGFSCGQTCGQPTGGFQGLCLGGKLVAQAGAVFLDDCTFVAPSTGFTHTCLCAVF